MTATDAGAIRPVNPEDDPKAELAAMTSVAAPTREQMLALQNRSPEMQRFDADMRYAIVFARSGLFKGVNPGDVQRGAAQAFVKIQAGRELGLPPMAAMRSVYVFDGQIALAAPQVLAQVNTSDKYEYDFVKDEEDEAVVAFYRLNPQTGERLRKLGESKFTLKEAQTAGLLSKDNWQKYRRRMMRWRAVQDGVKMFCPEVTNGIPTPDEINPDVQLDAMGYVVNNNVLAAATAGANAGFAVNGDARDPDPQDAEIADLAKKLHWQRANVRLTLTRFDDDKDRLLEYMRAMWEKERTSARQSARNGDERPPNKDDVAYIEQNRAEERANPEPPEANPAYDAPGSITNGTRKELFKAMNDVVHQLFPKGIKDKADRLTFARAHGVKIDSYTKISENQARALIDAILAWREGKAPLVPPVGGPQAQEAAPDNRVKKLRCDACNARRGEPHTEGCPVDETDEPDPLDGDGGLA